MNENTCNLIKPINKEVVHQICSGQVILSLAVAVKELVENSIDAGASIIDITLDEYGSKCIEVCDNGRGVHEKNFQSLTLKHHTSKIDNFSDLQFLETLGFRGEALSSLCALADLSVITKHSSANEARKIKYGKDGTIKESCLAARQVGTTVTLENLFSLLPVRRKEFLKNLKREFNKMCQLLYAYCLVSKGIKFTCTNSVKGKKNVVVATQGYCKVKENIISVFGGKQISSLIEVDIIRPSKDILDEYNLKLSEDDDIPFEMEFFISSVIHGNGRNAMDRQFFYVNSRPVEPTKIIKLVNQIYKQFNNNQYPFVYLNILVKSSIVDVNVTPDKRQIFLEKEKLFLAIIKASLLDAFKLFPSQVPLENRDVSQMLSFSKSERGKSMKRSLTDSPDMKKSFFESFKKKHKSENDACTDESTVFASLIAKQEENDDSMKDISDYDDNITSSKQDSTHLMHEEISCKFIREQGTKENIIDYKSEAPKEDNAKEEHIMKKENFILQLKDDERRIKDIAVNLEAEDSKECDAKGEHPKNGVKLDEREVKDTEIKLETEDSREYVEVQGKKKEENKSAEKNEIVNIILDTPMPKNKIRKTVQYNISLKDIEDSIKRNNALKSDSDDVKIKFRSIIAPENNKSAEEELQKQLSKNDFSKMAVVGQFNLGFILTRLHNDLFIIDQHATDEKYNFEKLQASTVLQKQVLVNPKSLELTAGNEGILIENEEIFKKNGFHFKIDEHAPASKRILLTAVPVSQNYVFGKDDIDEMLFMLKDSSQTMCRPSRVRAMFASRACRKSVMIGKSLSKNDMKTLVEHMGEIDQPWNCPHGRPTIRHLINMDLISADDEI